MRSLARRAKRDLGLVRVSEAHAGAVAAVQRTDSAMRLNVHLHVLALDGVYVERDGKLEFHTLSRPTQAEVAEVAKRTAARVEKLLRAGGRSLDPELEDTQADPPRLAIDEPGLAACYAAAAQGVGVAGARAGQPALRLVVQREQATQAGVAEDQPVAEVRGINVHAKQVVDGRDRKQLERLCRYVTRPPLAQERLHKRSDGRLELELKHVWRDGTRAILLEPHDLIARLVAAIPPPRFHLTRYFGVLSSHAKLRPVVVPSRPARPRPPECPDQVAPASLNQLHLFGQDPSEDGRDAQDAARRKPWGWLLRHVFARDLNTCPHCAAPMRWVEVATKRARALELMRAHGLEPPGSPGPSGPDPPARRLHPAQLKLAFTG